jgi:hypothetical protein
MVLEGDDAKQSLPQSILDDIHRNVLVHLRTQMDNVNVRAGCYCLLARPWDTQGRDLPRAEAPGKRLLDQSVNPPNVLPETSHVLLLKAIRSSAVMPNKPGGV